MEIIKPWGSYIEHFRAADLSVCYKTLFINSTHSISVQFHQKRSEIWYIADVAAEYVLTLDKNENILRGNRKIEIPLGCIHSIKNICSNQLIIYEFQWGVCEEEDIIRICDPYQR